MNKIYGIIWGQCTQELQSVLKGSEDFISKSKPLNFLWLIQDTKKITAGVAVKLNKSDSLYHCIRSFINSQQVENESNDTFKFHWDNVYGTMDMEGG